MAHRRQGNTTLSVFIQALEGTRLVIELRSDTIVRGTLDSVDEALNLQMSDATVKTLDGATRTASNLYLRGSSVRFIHLPGNLDPAKAMDARRNRVAQARRELAARQGAASSIAKGQQFESRNIREGEPS